MKTVRPSSILVTGFAVFSMFFGAGNVVFPLVLGRAAQAQNGFAFFGLFLTAVVIPFLGLLAMTLFDGNYRQFFGRIGKGPGFLLEILILALIGPFGALPRCIVLAHSSLHLYLEQISLPLFSVLACITIFLCTYKRSRMLDILGFILTPILLVCLLIIIGKGWWAAPPAETSSLSWLRAFTTGFVQGYQTMDLLGAFFFSSVVLVCLRRELNTAEATNHPKLMQMTIQAGCIGMSLLTLVYWGFTFLASHFSPSLVDVPKEDLLGKIALLILGPHMGALAGLAVALACLTTAIALAAVFAEFLHEDIFSEKVSYANCLLITLLISYGISTLRFEGIAQLLTPVLAICYPALIMLTLLNLLYKLTGFRIIQGPFYVAIFVSFIAYFF